MAPQPEALGTGTRQGAPRPCPDCGSPMESGPETGHWICRGCYDAYVDNAGR